jgi:hypothetical protein
VTSGLVRIAIFDKLHDDETAFCCGRIRAGGVIGSKTRQTLPRNTAVSVKK